jgi:anti-anti-sigma factor
MPAVRLQTGSRLGRRSTKYAGGVDPPGNACDVIREPDRVRVAPVGDLDLAATGELEATCRELLASGVDHLVVDLGNVTFIDSRGLRAIIQLHAAAQLEGWTFALLPGSAEVQRIFEVTGTRELLPFEP